MTHHLLPPEIWQKIALYDSEVYHTLALMATWVLKNFPLSRSDCMRLFTRQIAYKRIIVWKLPNGLCHSPDNDTPAYIHSVTTNSSICTDSYYYHGGEYHRNGDLPALEDSNGSVGYYTHGKPHRDGDQPAYIRRFGTEVHMRWYKHGVLHRDGDQPADIVTGSVPSVIYYYRGVLHRDGDQPAKIINNGVLVEYYKYGLRHRDNDRPAVIRSDIQEYWTNGVLHRENGPAVVRANGINEYWHHGEFVSL